MENSGSALPVVRVSCRATYCGENLKDTSRNTITHSLDDLLNTHNNKDKGL